jgi:L-rhamnose mutarotase
VKPAKPQNTKDRPVIRRAFTLRLKPGSFEKYKQYHDNIWPELVREIEKCGIAQITTFENELQLFLYSEIYDKKGWDKLWNSKIHDEWAKCMEPLMQFRADGKVDAGPLQEIFHLETDAGKPKKNSMASATKTTK